MHEILDPKETGKSGALWLGDYTAALDKDTLEYRGIRTVLTTAQGLNLLYPSSAQIEHRQWHMMDHPSFHISRFFEEVIQEIDEGLKRGGVLVHCAAGISRSASCVIAYLMDKKRMTFPSAVNYVKKIRRIVQPNPGFIKQLQLYERHLMVSSKDFKRRNREKSQGILKQLKNQPESTEKNTQIEGLQLTVKKDSNRAQTVGIISNRSLGGLFETKREINKNEGDKYSQNLNKVKVLVNQKVIKGGIQSIGNGFNWSEGNIDPAFSDIHYRNGNGSGTQVIQRNINQNNQNDMKKPPVDDRFLKSSMESLKARSMRFSAGKQRNTTNAIAQPPFMRHTVSGFFQGQQQQQKQPQQQEQFKQTVKIHKLLPSQSSPLIFDAINQRQKAQSIIKGPQKSVTFLETNMDVSNPHRHTYSGFKTNSLI